MSFEDACEALGLDATKLPDVSMLHEKHQKAITAHYKLVTIAEALNEGWTPDWSNHREYKYLPWFNVVKKEGSGSGFGLAYGGYGSLEYGYVCRLSPLLQNFRFGKVRRQSVQGIV